MGTPQKCIEEQQLEFPILFSGEVWFDELVVLLGVRSLPCTIVIDQNGNFAGEKLPGMDFTETIEKLMAP